MAGIISDVRVTTTRRTYVEIQHEAMKDIIRKAVGAPDGARVEISEFGNSSVEWSEQADEAA